MSTSLLNKIVMNKKIVCLLVLVFFGKRVLNAQEIGANFNHDPEIIDITYLKKTPVEWIRTTPYIFEYINGQKDPATEIGLAKIIEAKEAGYNVAFGFRWDFKKHNLSIPEPGSAEENTYFGVASAILNRVGSYIDIFKLGNEPNLETKEEDLQRNADGVVPLVRFTKRLLTEVVEPYYKNHPEQKRPDVYVGSFPALFERKHQQSPAVLELIKWAHENKNIKGLSIHLHIADSTQMDEVFRFVRNMMPAKPIIVPEYSLFRLYNKHVGDELGDSPEGILFAKRYNYVPSMKVYEWYTKVNTQRVSTQEWSDFFASRKWFPKNFMQTYYRYFAKSGVVLATYGYFSQSAPQKVGPGTPIWFVNPIFPGKSLLPHADGSIMENPLWFNDFVNSANKGKELKESKKSKISKQ
jgi:hypothetical protein